jgi:hypothetical protein
VPHSYVSVSQREALIQWAYQLNLILDSVRLGRRMPPVQIDSYVSSHRRLMALLGRRYAPMMALMERYKSRRLSLQKLGEEMGRYRDEMLANGVFPSPVVAELVREHVRPSAEFLASQVSTEPLGAPVDTGATVSFGEGLDLRRFETARYTSQSPFTALRAAVRELEAAGGEVRQVELRKGASFKKSDYWAPASFRVDASGRPIISLDMLAPDALGGLNHSLAQFRQWQALFARESKSAGVESAARAAFGNLLEGGIVADRRAVKAELSRGQHGSPLMRAFSTALFKKSRAYHEQGFIATALYPDVLELDRMIARDGIGANRVADRLRSMLSRARVIKRLSIQRLLSRADAFEAAETGGMRLEARRLRTEASKLQRTSLFDLVFAPANLNVFRAQPGKVESLERLYSGIRAEFEESPADLSRPTYEDLRSDSARD